MYREIIPYQDKDIELEAFVAYQTKEKRPIVILCHSWEGQDDFIREKSQMVASWGYVGFALDMYGKGVLGKSKEQNAALKRPFIDNRQLLQQRIMKAFEVACQLSYVDENQIVVLGLGFGGLCALDLARSGANLKGAVSIYGHFDPLPSHLIKSIKAKILILHGSSDPVVPISELRNFEREMEEAHVDWQTHIYGNTMHAFTTPSANDPISGILYNPISAARAWKIAKDFFGEIFSLSICS